MKGEGTSLGTLLRIVERIAILAGLFLAGFVALETLRAYQTLAELHPAAGYAFLGAVALLLLYFLLQLRPLFTLPRVPRPPDLPREGPVGAPVRRRFVRYLRGVQRRMALNPHLVDRSSDLDRLRRLVDELEGASRSGDEFRQAVRETENAALAPLLAELDQRAEDVVSDSVGIVSLGTALSPYRSLDMMIVLGRNLRMVNRVLHIYRTRPTPGETAAVLWDVARVVAAVNVLNAMDTVWAGLGRHVPLVGRYGEAMSEGLFSGLLTSVAGHAAIDRCRSYRPWAREEAVRVYRSRLQRWGRDVWTILRRHGIDRLFGRRGAAEEPGTSPGGKGRGILGRFRK